MRITKFRKPPPISVLGGGVFGTVVLLCSVSSVLSEAFREPGPNTVSLYPISSSSILYPSNGYASSDTNSHPDVSNSKVSPVPDPSDSNVYPNYQDPNFYNRRSWDSEEEMDRYDYPIRRRSSDSNARSMLFKTLVLAPLAVVVFALMVLLVVPIPVISQPIGGRSLSTSSVYSTTMQMAKDVLVAEECVERVSCELSRFSRAYNYISWIPPTLEKHLVKNKWSEKIIRGIQNTTREDSSCSQFTCNAAKNLKRSWKLK